MCGICGIVSRREVSDREIDAVRRINNALVHRGPDGDGEYSAEKLFLAMRRLSIIDLEGGWQPLYNEDKSVALVANGEIYNFIELRSSLESKGHNFATGSDCETIAHLYEEYGLDFVDHLRGMFAVALWDAGKKRLLLARDRMGEKPLYIYEGDGRIIFASEMKALLSSGEVPFGLEPGAVCDYFHYNYVPEPRTAVRGVRKLPAGHFITIDVDSWKIGQHCYWRMEDAEPLDGNPKDLIRAQLEDIGNIILRSDVPVGVALSAGLDSSTVAMLAAQKSPGKIHALTVGFEGAGWRDERPGAKEFAKHMDMPFHETEISLDDVVRMFPQGCIDKDDPIADVASHGYYAVSRLARENNIPVLLQGQGSDELFWGYVWLRRAMGASMRKYGIPGKPPRDYAPFRSMLPMNLHFTGLRDYAFLVGGKLQGWGRSKPSPEDQLVFYDQSKTFQMGRYAVERIFTSAYIDELQDHNPADLFTLTGDKTDIGVLITKLACESFLIENGIAQGDRLSSISSIEIRLPLVDYRLVETVIGLRKRQQDQHLQPKAWFKEVIREYLPEWVLNRPKKGFSPPASLWMNVLRDKYGKSLLDGYLVENGVLKAEAVEMMIKPHSQLTAWPITLYKTMVLEYWARGLAQI